MKRLMRMKRLLLLPLLIIAWLLAGTAVAQAPVTATLSGPQEPLTVGDPINLTLTVAHPNSYRVIPPAFDSEAGWGDFVVQAISPAETVDNGDGTSTTTIAIDARLFAPGAYQTPPLAISVTDGAGQLSNVPVTSVPVTIASVLTAGDTELRDIKPQAELPFINWLPWLLGGLLLALLAGGGYLFWRRRQAQRALAAVDNRLPHEVALDQLTAVAGLGLPEQGRFKEHYSLVTDTVRGYLETTYGLPMTERTTGEIQRELRGSAMPRGAQQQLLAFLQESDLVKFADLIPSEAEAYELVAQGRAIVEATRPAPLAVGAATDTTDYGFSENGRSDEVEVRTHE